MAYGALLASVPHRQRGGGGGSYTQRGRVEASCFIWASGGAACHLERKRLRLFASLHLDTNDACVGRGGDEKKEQRWGKSNTV